MLIIFVFFILPLPKKESSTTGGLPIGGAAPTNIYEAVLHIISTAYKINNFFQFSFKILSIEGLKFFLNFELEIFELF